MPNLFKSGMNFYFEYSENNKPIALNLGDPILHDYAPK